MESSALKAWQPEEKTGFPGDGNWSAFSGKTLHTQTHTSQYGEAY